MDIKVVRYESSKKIVWDNFVTEAKNATFLFKRDFMDYHSDRFEDASLLIYKKNKLVALFPANKFGEFEVISHQGLTYGGIMFSKKDKLGSIKGYVKEILIYLNNLKIEVLTWKMFPSIYNETNSDEIEYLMFLLDSKLYRRDVALVVSANSVVKYSGNYRREAKKAEKANAVIKKDDFNNFWKKILIPNLKIKHDVDPVHSLEEIELLRKKFPKNIIQYNVFLNNEIVGGTTLFVTPSCVHCQYISANDIGRKSGALNYLFIHLLDKIYPEIANFDFGIVNESDSLSINEGLLFWKENMGGRTIKHDFYRVDTKNHLKLD